MLGLWPPKQSHLRAGPGLGLRLSLAPSPCAGPPAAGGQGSVLPSALACASGAWALGLGSSGSCAGKWWQHLGLWAPGRSIACTMISALPDRRGCPSAPAASPGSATPTAQPQPHKPCSWVGPWLPPALSYQVRVLESDVAPGYHLTVAMGPGQCLLGTLRPIRAAGQKVSFVHWLWVRGGSR